MWLAPRKGTTGIALFNTERELIGSLDVEIGPDTDKLNQSLKAALGRFGSQGRNPKRQRCYFRQGQIASGC